MKRAFLVVFTLIISVALAVLLIGCKNPPTEGAKAKVTAIAVTGVPVNSLVVGAQSVQLGYSTIPDKNVEAVTVKFEVDSNHAHRLECTADGLITPLSEGEATVTASVTTSGYKNIKNSVTISIVAAIQQVPITAIAIASKPTNNTISAGDLPIALTYVTTPVNANNFEIEYLSSNTDVVTVGAKTGVLTSVSEGTATITIQVKGEGFSSVKDSFIVTVIDPTKGELSGYNLVLAGGAKQDSQNIKIDIPSNANDWGNSASIAVSAQNFTVTVKMRHKPKANSLQGGIMLHEAGYTAVKMVRVFADSANSFQFNECSSNVMANSKTVEDNISSQTIYLRIIKNANNIAGYFSEDNIDFTLVSIGTSQLDVSYIRLFGASWTTAIDEVYFEDLDIDYTNYDIVNPNLVSFCNKQFEKVGNTTISDNVATIVSGGQTSSSDINAGIFKDVQKKQFTLTVKLEAPEFTGNQRAGIILALPNQQNSYLRIQKHGDSFVVSDEGSGLLASGNNSRLTASLFNSAVYFKIVRDNANLYVFVGNSLSTLKSVGKDITLKTTAANSENMIAMLCAADYGAGSITAKFSDYTQAETADFEKATVTLNLTESYTQATVNNATVLITQAGKNVEVVNGGSGNYLFTVVRATDAFYTISGIGLKEQTGKFADSDINATVVLIDKQLIAVTVITFNLSSDTDGSLSGVDISVVQEGGYVSDVTLLQQNKYAVTVKRGSEFKVTITADNHDPFTKLDCGAPATESETFNITIIKTVVVKFTQLSLTIKNNKQTAEAITNATVTVTQGTVQQTVSHTQNGVYTATLKQGVLVNISIVASGVADKTVAIPAAELTEPTLSKLVDMHCVVKISATYTDATGNAILNATVKAKQVAEINQIAETVLTVTNEGDGVYEITALSMGGKVEITTTATKTSVSVITINADDVAYEAIKKRATLYNTSLNSWNKEIDSATQHEISDADENWQISKVNTVSANNWSTSLGRVINGTSWQASVKISVNFSMQHQSAGFFIGGIGNNKYNASTFVYSNEFNATNGHIGSWGAKGTSSYIFGDAEIATEMTSPLTDVYLKLVRNANKIEMFYSLDGEAFTRVGERTISEQFANDSVVLYLTAWAYQDSTDAPYFSTTLSNYTETYFA